MTFVSSFYVDTSYQTLKKKNSKRKLQGAGLDLIEAEIERDRSLSETAHVFV